MTDRLNEFINFIKESGTSDNTRQAYERDLKQLFQWLEKQEIYELPVVGGAHLMQYVDIMSSEGKSAATISRSIASIKKFFSFSQSRGYTFSDPSKMLKAPKVIRKAPSVISDKDIRKLLNVPDLNTNKGVRDKAMLELMVATGLCVTEIIELGLDDVDFKSNMIHVGGKQRKISINKKTADYLRNYLKIRKQFMSEDIVDEGTCFLSCAGEKMTRQGFWKLIRTSGKAAGIEEITPQMLRHSFAVSALKHGKDIATLQKMLGHSSKAGSLEYQNLIMG